MNDYAAQYRLLDEEQLLALWRERSMLVKEAKAGLEKEFQRRNIRDDDAISAPDHEKSGEHDQNQKDRGIEMLARVLLYVWVVLLIPWVIFAMFAGMAFDGGNSTLAALFVISLWSYGPAVFGAFKLLDRSRAAVVLPGISILGTVLFDHLLSVWR